MKLQQRKIKRKSVEKYKLNAVYEYDLLNISSATSHEFILGTAHEFSKHSL